jgi:hypothetical protein
VNKAEVAQLLTVIAQVDNRKLEPATVEAWFEILGYLDYSIAAEAAKLHFRESSEYLMPVHIITRSKKLKELLEREERRLQPAIAAKEITFDRQEFDRQVAKAIEFYRKEKTDV